MTLLSKENLGYASTSQTIGLNTGYFLSFTVFLALNSADFANKYFRSIPSELPFVTLAGYLKFWGVSFVAVTAYLLSVPTEVRTVDWLEVSRKRAGSRSRGCI